MTDCENIKQAIVENEVVQFFWHIISGEWEEESSVALLNMIAVKWLKICRFSFAGAWMENSWILLSLSWILFSLSWILNCNSWKYKCEKS